MNKLDGYYRKIDFIDFIDSHMRASGITTDAELSRKSMVSKSVISRMRSGKVSIKRDYLWSFALALRLTIDETETLFNSCNNSIYGCYRMTGEEIAREQIIENFIIEGQWNIDAVNSRLYEMGMPLLGNTIEKS